MRYSIVNHSVQPVFQLICFSQLLCGFGRIFQASRPRYCLMVSITLQWHPCPEQTPSELTCYIRVLPLPWESNPTSFIHPTSVATCMILIYLIERSSLQSQGCLGHPVRGEGHQIKILAHQWAQGPHRLVWYPIITITNTPSVTATVPLASHQSNRCW